MDSGVCPSHNVLQRTKNNTLFLKLDLLTSSQEILGGLYTIRFMRVPGGLLINRPPGLL